MSIKKVLVFLLMMGVSPLINAESVNLRLNINFDVNETGFGVQGERTLDRLYDVAQTLLDAEILISGHTDSTGPQAYNLELSLRRAASVVAYLGKRGLEEERLVAKGFGEAAPIETNDTLKGRAKNRRVVASIIGMTSAELASVMQFLRKTPAPPVVEAIEEALPVETYKKELVRTKKVRRKRKRFYVTGFFGPHWSSVYYGGDLSHEHSKFTMFSGGIDAGMKISKRWFLDSYFYYLPTEIKEGGSGIDFVGTDHFKYENNLYGLRLGYTVKNGRNYRFSLIGGVSSHIMGALEPLGSNNVRFGKFEHIGVTMGFRHEQKITSKWVFDSDLAYLFPISVDGLASSKGTLWYRGILGVKRKLSNRLRLGVEYQLVYHESKFNYKSGSNSTPEFLIQTLMAGLKYTF